MKETINYFKEKIRSNAILIEHCQRENKKYIKILEEIRKDKIKRLGE